MTEEHYRALWERVEKERNWYKGLLYDAWNTVRGQNKGLNRQRRLIKRLQAEKAELSLRRAPYGHRECPECDRPAFCSVVHFLNDTGVLYAICMEDCEFVHSPNN